MGHVIFDRCAASKEAACAEALGKFRPERNPGGSGGPCAAGAVGCARDKRGAANARQTVSQATLQRLEFFILSQKARAP